MEKEIKKIIESQKEFFSSGVTKDLRFRLNQLELLYNLIVNYEDEITNALYLDLNKSEYESYLTEIGFTLSEIRFIRKRLRQWAKPKKVKTTLSLFPAKSYIYSEPYGVTLIISPWNYPFQLSISPLIGAIAAGNCIVIKPSEYSINTSKILSKLINENFPSNYIKVIEGGIETNQLLLKEKFDYIFFTGSVNVGKIVMQEASKHLTPVTLELGGKSPCIVDKDADLKLAAKRIVWGKFVNAGQTCVAPDYLLVHSDVKEKLISLMIDEIQKMYYANKKIESYYPRIIHEKRFNHLLSLLDNENIIFGGVGNFNNLIIEPTIIDNVRFNSPVMQEEIFGPILPIITFESIEEVIKNVNEQDKPLALYIFSNSKKFQDTIINSISHGGGCINDTIMHLATPNLPFGGIGSSGIGSYHGKASFDTFSHKKSILKRGKIDIALRYPPYNKSKKWLKRILK